MSKKIGKNAMTLTFDNSEVKIICDDKNTYFVDENDEKIGYILDGFLYAYDQIYGKRYICKLDDSGITIVGLKGDDKLF